MFHFRSNPINQVIVCRDRTESQEHDLWQQYESRITLFRIQPEPLLGFFLVEGRMLAEGLVHRHLPLRYTLPDQVVDPNESRYLSIPEKLRWQRVVNPLSRLVHADVSMDLNLHLRQLEKSHERGLALSATVLRHAIVLHLIQGMDLNFLQQESTQCVSILRSNLGNLDLAEVLAPYIVIDETYRQKRLDLVRQLANHGRTLSRYQTHEMIVYIQRRAADNTLNRGLSLSLPYFDDRALEICTYDFEVIPRGRVLFVPAFVVTAARREQDRVQRDPRFSPSTRNHLLAELKEMERAFDMPSGSTGGGLKERKKRPVSQAEEIPDSLRLDQAV